MNIVNTKDLEKTCEETRQLIREIVRQNGIILDLLSNYQIIINETSGIDL